jgi:Fur family transcriptional regulator, peroxide stress response regulator
MSRQKELIYNLVTSTVSHPTADWVYENARRKMPHISLGTVYRNLNTLVREGRILAITNARGPVRYDANITRHSHLNCIGCGLMLDVPEAEIDFAPRSPKIRQFEVLEYRIEFFCLCPDCRKKNASKKQIYKRRINADPERQKSKRQV